jgi:hypothetical protein
MKIAKAPTSVQINRSPESDAGANVQALRQVENGDAETSASGLHALLHQVSEASRREIGNLVGELRSLDEKLQTDGDRIQQDIEQYAELNHHILQLTAIIADGVKRLPEPAR